MKSLNLVQQHWVVEHVLGHAGIGKKMVEWKMQENDECPRYRVVEDTRHIWTCQSPAARILRSQHFYKLQQWMVTTEMDPDIQKAISTQLTAWSLGTSGTQIQMV
jgi:hypothetical protein